MKRIMNFKDECSFVDYFIDSYKDTTELITIHGRSDFISYVFTTILRECDDVTLGLVDIEAGLFYENYVDEYILSYNDHEISVEKARINEGHGKYGKYLHGEGDITYCYGCSDEYLDFIEQEDGNLYFIDFCGENCEYAIEEKFDDYLKKLNEITYKVDGILTRIESMCIGNDWK